MKWPFKKSEFERQMAEQDRKIEQLLSSIKEYLPELEQLSKTLEYEYEDGMYRFYHYSFKVARLQDSTEQCTELFRKIAEQNDLKLNKWFEQIVAEGTGKVFELEHNENWLFHYRPVVEAFLHAKYFLEMMIKSAHKLEKYPEILPSGWAAVLYLYDLR